MLSNLPELHISLLHQALQQALQQNERLGWLLVDSPCIMNPPHFFVLFSLCLVFREIRMFAFIIG